MIFTTASNAKSTVKTSSELSASWFRQECAESGSSVTGSTLDAPKSCSPNTTEFATMTHRMIRSNQRHVINRTHSWRTGFDSLK
jgi:hypothetical protein